MTDEPRITDTDLHAYVDGWLDGARVAAVEAHLAANPRDRERVDAWRAQAATIGELFAHVAAEDVPGRLDVRAIADARRRRRVAGLRLAAAAVVLLAVGATAGWQGRALLGGLPVGASLVAEAEAAHTLYTPEVVHPVEVKADEARHLSGWLSKRLARTLVLPDLTPEGFSLVGGRLLPAGDEPAAQLMYQDADGRRVTLYMVPGEAGERSLRFVGRDGLAAVAWRTQALGCVLVGDLPREALMRLARASYGALDGDADI